MLNKWETIIGIETHIQLSTQSKLFSNSSTTFCFYPNKQICNLDIGMPGVLPRLNKTAIDMAIRFGLIINTKIYNTSIFERKNYFYPDLPKGYQISQRHKPILGSGKITIYLNKNTTLYIDHINLEEDAGKLLHKKTHSAIDFNRSGIPLLEIITKPCILNYNEVLIYLNYINKIVKYINISDADLSKGSMRCDINISIRNKGNKKLNNYIELKNLNSYKYIKSAILYETKRQINLLNKGGKIIKETRLYNFKKNKTYTLRKKENTNDYLYLNCPDLLELNLNKTCILTQNNSLPDLPHMKIKNFLNLGLSFKEAKLLTNTLEIAIFVEKTFQICKDIHLTSIWIRCYLFEKLKVYYLNITQNPIKATFLGKLLFYIKHNLINHNIAKIIFNQLWKTNLNNIETEINKLKKEQINDNNLLKMINLTLKYNILKIILYNKSTLKKKKQILNFLIGQVIKKSKTKANPKHIKFLIKKLI
ncbi:Asp-tRNA(Asn)/Glu-tRNA(Gln) amidotransferase subunit GatB [Candidatus Portiera aleyrodidarum]|uniref:Aspartyl/glutamyl-tRNA(Asn/Gln) amidotransferase subunit B n=1 Tax=Candidatus Portiera aleyrodidarum TV TaxID=1297582 RepID=A0A8D3X7N9_9GAMM|nr:Asp-tRNA(Asn)/Glu-tRNA(Gln) amidotransferase subunit GatB [Candidatus Portiera aleyrodidarum]AGI27205.1 glutamyl-tRNA(Gln) and/or aspartyl-tRNA(Asn) amidotransferase, B subunit [Candidatus Portiera aleyrodidarum TV]